MPSPERPDTHGQADTPSPDGQTHGPHDTILERAVAGAPLRDVLTAVCRQVETLCPAFVCSVMLPTDGTLHCEAAPTLPEALRDALKVPVAEGEGACGTAAATGRTVLIEDIAHHPDCVPYRALATEHGLRAVVSIPLEDAESGLLGTFALYSRQTGPFPPDAVQVLRRLAQVTRLVLKHYRLLDTLRWQADHDPVTDLPNRRALQARTQELLDAGGPLTVAALELVTIRDVTENLGHVAGEAVLQVLAARLRAACQGDEYMAHVSAGEFMVLLPELTPAQAADRVRTLLDLFRSPVPVGRQVVRVSVKAGLHHAPQPELGALEALRFTEMALQQASHGACELAVFDPTLLVHSQRRFTLGRALRSALEQGELAIHYQPTVDLDTARITGAEALLRWQHPVFGGVSPAEFIPLAEASGDIIPIGRWVLHESCKRAAEAVQAGHRAFRMAVNVSASQVERPDFLDVVHEALAASGLPPEHLILELTERVVLHRTPLVNETLLALRALGVSLAMDDFGTEYSSLGSLPELPVNILKIDHTFVSCAEGDAGRVAVLEVMLRLARRLNLQAVAEGIETRAQWERLRELGCREGQGYLFARPGPDLCVHDLPLHPLAGPPGRLLDRPQDPGQ